MKGHPGYVPAFCEPTPTQAELGQLISWFETPSIQQGEGGFNPLFGESEWELEQRTRCPVSTTATVSGFPRYQNTVGSLPPSEQQKVRAAALLIVRSFQPGCRPILSVRLVGHADRDLARERREPGF